MEKVIYICYINDTQVNFSTFLKEAGDSGINPNQLAAVLEGFEYIGKYNLIFKIKIVEN